jgi:predicted tellurium resistance membrane protein TerC
MGLGLALVARLALLATLGWIMSLTRPMFAALGLEVTGQRLILIAGGLFLMGKSVFEIHEKLEGKPGDRTIGATAKSIGIVLLQVVVLDIVFSLDSVITGVGMVPKSVGGIPYLLVIAVAMVVTVGVMLFLAGPIGDFVNRHPTMKVLALSFLLLIGFLLVAEGLDKHVPKGYVYFAMAFSLGVEFLNMRIRKRVEPVHLHEPQAPAA